MSSTLSMSDGVQGLVDSQILSVWPLNNPPVVDIFVTEILRQINTRTLPYLINDHNGIADQQVQTVQKN